MRSRTALAHSDVEVRALPTSPLPGPYLLAQYFGVPPGTFRVGCGYLDPFGLKLRSMSRRRPRPSSSGVSNDIAGSWSCRSIVAASVFSPPCCLHFAARPPPVPLLLIFFCLFVISHHLAAGPAAGCRRRPSRLAVAVFRCVCAVVEVEMEG